MNKRRIIASTVTTIVAYLFLVGVCFAVDGTLQTGIMTVTLGIAIITGSIITIGGLVFLWEWANKD